jgi:integrase
MRRRVEFRVGGRDSRVQYGGSFKTLREATVRRNWIAGELAAKRVPDLTHVETKAPKLPMFPEAFDVWRASRVDVDEQTRNMHRSSVGRIFKVAPHLRGRRVDELTVDDVAVLIAGLAEAGYKRETIRKTRTVLSQTLDFYELEPNVARDERVKLPKERKPHIPPPLAEHVERVAETMPREYVLPLLVIDECGPRVRELETAEVGDLDEHRKAIRVRWTFEKNDRYRHLELPDDLFAARIATSRRRSFPSSPTRACGWPSPAPAGRPGRRTSRRTAYAVDGVRCTTSALARSPTSPNCSVTRSVSRPSTTSTRSRTTGRSTGRSRSLACRPREMCSRVRSPVRSRTPKNAQVQGCSIPARPIHENAVSAEPHD